MRLTTVLLVAALMQASAASIAQKITLNKEHADLRSVFKSLRAQSGYNFVYADHVLELANPVNISVKAADFEDVLKSIFSNQPLTYKIDNNAVIVQARPYTYPQLIKNRIKITGLITDEKGDPLPGAGVKLKGTEKAVVADQNGRYAIEVGEGAVLIFTYLGYETAQIVVGARTNIDVKLKSSSNALEETVVIGYSTISKKDLTGAVTTLDAAKSLKDIPANSAAEALTGRLAGVQITGSEGSLEAEHRIVIRGGTSITQDNSPLYIIDGIQVEDGLTSVSPQDIERIDVLKDASATSIYGSRGANGVVLVTTKGGKSGTAVISYNGLYGTSTLPKTLPVMSPYEFVTYQYDRLRTVTERQGFARNYNTDGAVTLTADWADLERYRDMTPVDWQQEVMGRTGQLQTHNISVSGGTTATKYNFSFTNTNQSGILLNTDMKRNLLNAKLDQTVNDKLSLTFTLRYTDTKNSGASTSDAGNAQVNGMRNIVKYKPFLNDGVDVDDFEEDYFDLTNTGNGLGLLNPVVRQNGIYRKVNSAVTNIGGSINYKFNQAWSIRSMGGMNIVNKETRGFREAFRKIDFPSTSFANNNDRTFNQSNVLTYTNSKSPSKFARKHRITTLLGQEVFISQGEDLNNSLSDYPRGITPEEALTQLTQGTIRVGFPNREYNRNTLLSFFGRANYTFDNKYLAAFTLRADGSSKFAKGKRWGYFPSASFAWRISDENFMENVNLVNDVKLRLSYGVSGNNRIQDYSYIPNYAASDLYPLSSAPNNGLNSFGYQMQYLPNPDLKWETTIQSNIGLDFSFLKKKVQASVDLYSNRSRDVLTNSDITPTTGYIVQLQNTADTWNRGLEVQLSGTVLKRKNFSWNTDFNISFNKNTVEKLTQGQTSQEFSSGWVINGQNDFLVQVGESVGNIYGYVVDGFHGVDDFDYNTTTRRYTLKAGLPDPTFFTYPAPGTIKIKDLSGNGVIGSEDRQIIGNAIPLFFGGINQQFTYKNFDASLFMNFSVGNDILNANKLEFSNGYLHHNNLLQVMEGRWRNVDQNGNSILESAGSAANTVITGAAPDVLREVNKDANIWFPIRSNPGYYTTDWAVEDGTFLRLNNITLGYTFKSALLTRIKVKRARIYATGSNLGVWTNYSGYDPEVNTRRRNGLTPGVDYAAYPRSRNFTFGLNLSL
ncbi:TonB-dependent receptor [Pedobacter heparinus]|uniref:TonB-dependent receptor n=1 Tax=Pedobacter heparinus TaxID=984 RepID=UPI00292D669A|nr:TonB-dependent receptor [Pedobacter heparinus]